MLTAPSDSLVPRAPPPGSTGAPDVLTGRASAGEGARAPADPARAKPRDVPTRLITSPAISRLCDPCEALSLSVDITDPRARIRRYEEAIDARRGEASSIEPGAAARAMGSGTGARVAITKTSSQRAHRWISTTRPRIRRKRRPSASILDDPSSPPRRISTEGPATGLVSRSMRRAGRGSIGLAGRAANSPHT